MSKLKTLKDIEKKCLDCTPIFLTEAMREEAIKWIETLEYAGGFADMMIIDDDHEEHMDGVIISKESVSFIKHFFNITEEDLK